MLVPSSFLPRAAGLNQTLLALMTVAAAPLGALAISVMPIGLALGIDVVTAVLGIVPLLIYRIPLPAAQSE
jgi:DHA3 family macrolide efflux protein-like MFS transporter